MIDRAALTAWMDGTGIPGRGEPVELRDIAGGSQNVIVEVTRGDFRAVLRMPPPNAPDDRDKGMAREWRILEALRDTDVPHPSAIAQCRDTDVLGRPFFLMGLVDGWSPMNHPQTWPAPFDADLEGRRGLIFTMMEGIALLGNVDWQAAGLTDLGRPDGFHERQVQRWTGFLDRIRGRDLPGFQETAEWLARNRPLDYVPGLMHGDYGFQNVMFGHDSPSTLAAIVDWEMATIGDPKLDLGWALHVWPESTDPASTGGDDGYLTGLPTREELAAHYAAVSGRQIDDLDYYLILAKWKLAVVLEQSYQRAGDNPRLLQFGPMVLDYFAGAAELAESTDFRNPPA